MTDRLIRPALRAILDAIEGIEAATQNRTINDFRADWLLRHGVQRGIEIISEAATPHSIRASVDSAGNSVAANHANRQHIAARISPYFRYRRLECRSAVFAVFAQSQSSRNSNRRHHHRIDYFHRLFPLLVGGGGRVRQPRCQRSTASRISGRARSWPIISAISPVDSRAMVIRISSNSTSSALVQT